MGKFIIDVVNIYFAVFTRLRFTSIWVVLLVHYLLLFAFFSISIENVYSGLCIRCRANACGQK